MASAALLECRTRIKDMHNDCLCPFHNSLVWSEAKTELHWNMLVKCDGRNLNLS